AHVNGVAHVTVTAKDNGGTANGGSDTSASQTFTITVNKNNVQVTVTPSVASAVWGQTVTFTANVPAVPPGNLTPSGTATFWDGPVNTGTNLGTQNLASGSASITLSTLSVATHTINVSYSGDGHYNTGLGTRTFVVSRASTTTTVSASANPSVLGSSVTFTATVAAVTSFSGTPYCSVTLVSDGSYQGRGSFDVSGLVTRFSSSLGQRSHI